MRSPLAFAALLVAAVLAGCSGGSKDPEPIEGGLDVSPTTGGIRGIVVDQAVVPIPGALVSLPDGKNTTSSDLGLFNFTGLAPGAYVLKIGKPGFSGAQVTAEVVADVPDPPVVKVLLQRLVTAQPYVDFYKLDGFYECAESLFFVVDTCDFVPRTVWDEYNQSQGSPPPVVPRSILRYYNTQEIDVPADTYSIIQEGFWTDETIPALWIMLDEYPVDAGCDCSPSYGGVDEGKPTYMRIDRYNPDGTEKEQEYVPGGFGDASDKPFPAGERVVARGFLPPADAPVLDGTDPTRWYAIAQNFQFTVITTLFHNYRAPEGWTFETQKDYPVG